MICTNRAGTTCSHDVGSSYGVTWSFVRSLLALAWSNVIVIRMCAVRNKVHCPSRLVLLTETVAANCAPSNLDWSCCTYSSPCANGEGGLQVLQFSFLNW